MGVGGCGLVRSTQIFSNGVFVGNIHEIPSVVKCKNREKYAPKKTITQDNIYVVW